jgi:hypothetical protein
VLRRLTLLAFALALAFLPAVAFADDNGDKGFVLRTNGPFTLDAGESAGTVIVVRGDALIGGTVEHALIVVNGSAVVGGTVKGNVTVIRGDVTLESGSHVNRVTIINGKVTQETGAIIDHGINRRGFRLGFFSVAFFWFLWLSLMLAVLLAGLLFAAVAGRQLSTSAELMTQEAALSILGAVGVWIGLPIVAVLALVTVVGIPFGLAILLLAMPVIGFLGYLVAGARLGGALLRAMGRNVPADHPYLAAVVGLALLQLIILLPVVGWAVAALAGLWGAGALAVLAFRAWRGHGKETSAAPPRVVANAGPPSP